MITIVKYHNLEIEIEKKNIKNIHLRIYPDGRIYLSSPEKITNEYLLEFIKKKEKWICDKRKIMEQMPKQNQIKEVDKGIISEYRKILNEKIPFFIQKWQPIMGVEVYEYHIKNMTTRWGSCNRVAHRIWISLNLAKLPEECLEYIIVHEMNHLLVAGHGMDFKENMSRFLPDWKQRDRMLRGR